MKRILLRKSADTAAKKVVSMNDSSALPYISEYITNLRLLKDVPFSYLVPNEALLPPESIRFFQVDENWLDSLTNGALSVGRQTEEEAKTDSEYLVPLNQFAISNLAVPRFKNTHENHRRGDCAHASESEIRTGYLLRSGLVSKWKGLESFGYCKDKQLEILRMEALTNEILLCIFDGELTKFVISEPKTGLRFGAPDSTGIITLRDVRDTEDFGNPLPGVTVDFSNFTESNGRLRAMELAKDMSKKLDSPVASPQLAFELIAVAKRAEFKKGGDTL